MLLGQAPSLVAPHVELAHSEAELGTQTSQNRFGTVAPGAVGLTQQDHFTHAGISPASSWRSKVGTATYMV